MDLNVIDGLWKHWVIVIFLFDKQRSQEDPEQSSGIKKKSVTVFTLVLHFYQEFWKEAINNK
jgi:hypothetical protein